MDEYLDWLEQHIKEQIGLDADRRLCFSYSPEAQMKWLALEGEQLLLLEEIARLKKELNE